MAEPGFESTGAMPVCGPPARSEPPLPGDGSETAACLVDDVVGPANVSVTTLTLGSTYVHMYLPT